jgi:acetyltransferase-like isoleucine patch superfamily enzyme
MSSIDSELQRLYDSLRTEMREQWDRDLPFYELLFDRWERARSLGFGEGASIYHSSYVFGDVAVGPKTWIGPHTILDGSGGLSIGANCSISAGVQIYSHDSVAWAVSGGAAEYERSAVSIGDNCYIGPQTVVARGVTIGEGCVIGACSFVNRSVPDDSLAAGTPCRRIGRVHVDGGDVTLERDDLGA